jgi:cobalt-precorrin 5A hydrolase / precorrin-3B C17-methyltransferase
MPDAQDGRPMVALGVGCDRNVTPPELERLVREVLAAHDLSPQAVTCVASLDVKADEGAIHALAASLGVPARFFDADALAREEPRLSSPSETVRQAVRVAGVAEAAALACTGPDGRLLVTKQRSAHATCAIATSSRTPASGDRS